MRPARATLTTAAILGLLTFATGCGQGDSSAVAGSPATATSTASPAPPSTPSSAPGTAPPSAPAPAASSPAASASPVTVATSPGVVADCTSAPPLRLSVRPASIVLSCANDGTGVQTLTWTAWDASTATGRGTFWEHVCTPSCAASTTFAHYPVTVTLSQVKTSAQGQWFGELTVTWLGKPPSSTTPDTYPLDAPGS